MFFLRIEYFLSIWPFPNYVLLYFLIMVFPFELLFLFQLYNLELSYMYESTQSMKLNLILSHVVPEQV